MRFSLHLPSKELRLPACNTPQPCCEASFDCLKMLFAQLELCQVLFSVIESFLTASSMKDYRLA